MPRKKSNSRGKKFVLLPDILGICLNYICKGKWPLMGFLLPEKNLHVLHFRNTEGGKYDLNTEKGNSSNQLLIFQTHAKLGYAQQTVLHRERWDDLWVKITGEDGLGKGLPNNPNRQMCLVSARYTNNTSRKRLHHKKTP